MDNGRVYYLYEGYTYTYGYKSRKGINWRCTKKRLCNAFIVVTEDGELVLVRGEHSHERNLYQNLTNGKYVKVSKITGARYSN